MSVQDKLAPYLNRFVTLLNQNESAKLEFCCQNGKVTVNFLHEMGEVEKAFTKDVKKTSQYSDVLKKNVKQLQSNRLHKRATIRAEEAIKARNVQKQLAEEALKDLKKAKISALRAKRETDKVKAKSKQEETKFEEGKSHEDKINDIVSKLNKKTFSITQSISMTIIFA